MTAQRVENRRPTMNFMYAKELKPAQIHFYQGGLVLQNNQDKIRYFNQ
jgi:hypothetical protein